MAAPPAASARPLGRGDAITHDRLERKYAVARADARHLVARLDAALERHAHSDGRTEPLPGTRHYATTVYFDTPSRDVLRGALSGQAHLKLRAREYYTFHPAFTQLATDPSQLVRFDPAVWLEIKMRRADRVEKTRIRVPKREVPAFFADGLISSEMVELQQSAFGDDAQQALREIAEVCRQFDESLRASCVVNYQRLAWQNDATTLRVTLDREVAFYEAPRDLWERDVAMTRASLGPPGAALDSCILEVKATAALPDWLDALLDTIEPPAEHMSKFVLASQALHG